MDFMINWFQENVFCVGDMHNNRNILFFWIANKIEFAIVWYAYHEYWSSRIWFMVNGQKNRTSGITLELQDQFAKKHLT